MKVTGALRSSSGAEVPASLIVRGGNWRRRGRTLLGRFAAKGGKEMVVAGGERELKRSFVLFCFVLTMGDRVARFCANRE